CLMCYRVGLVLLTTVAYVIPSPIHYDVLPYRAKRDNENSSTMATFTVERLDAPIERIEIRLIDENSTSNAVLESAAARPQPLQPSAVGGDNTANAIDTNTGSDDQYDVRYKKVEYVSDVMLTRQDNSPTELVAARSPDTNENTASTATGESPTHGDEATDENTPRTKARAWLSFSNGTPSDNDDIDVLAPEVEESSSDDEYEPVEECLLNRAELPLKTVQKLTEQARKLGKLIRTRNRLQQQYCINREQPQLNDEFRLCPIWRNEKKVHNYQLMRIKYCADYSKWPNASKLMSTYGDNLNLYETLYAFQKP
uniref:Secreted protein n=1 Tax=Haemonchus contortus TaxID=6289 RepID=A0A7I4YRH8_HAECO